MYLNKRQIDIILKALKDYDFIKEEIESKIKKGYNMQELCDYLGRFKDIDITNFDKSGDYTYIDFLYKDINTYISYKENETINVSNTLEIYDSIKQEYIIEDWLTKKDYMYEIGMVALSRLNKALEYCKESSLTIKSHFFSDLKNILEGEEMEVE